MSISTNINPDSINAVVDRQQASSANDLPNQDSLTLWVNTALRHPHVMSGALAQKPSLQLAELSVRLVDEVESQTLNCDYRQKNKPTNVLSFSADLPEFVDVPLLGDLIICAPVVAREAIEQHKKNDDHWAHMIIHGTLHLLGYDHIDENDATIMETIETEVLETLGIACPYAEYALPAEEKFDSPPFLLIP